jgi:hypothetical protein
MATQRETIAAEIRAAECRIVEKLTTRKAN